MFFGLDFTSPIFWSAFGSIVLANIVLSGDNAVVIAMAARTLKPEQQRKAIVWGSAAAIVMRIILTIVAIKLLTMPFLKVVGAVLLVYIGVDLLKGEDEEGEGDGKQINGMLAAVRTILIADLVMSLDNVLAVAAAAKGNVPLLVLGLLVSIPLIVFGATLLTKVMERFPIIITIGAALLGFLAGEMLLTDPAVAAQFGEIGEQTVTFAGIIGAVLVVALGTWLQKKNKSSHA
ncbi:TerC family protein [Rhodoferax sp.]|uniref:TerC family protein n=1 Tax=Rhodoferax sp. TaxID=50421 RepID=UPI00374C8E0E